MDLGSWRPRRGRGDRRRHRRPDFRYNFRPQFRLEWRPYFRSEFRVDIWSNRRPQFRFNLRYPRHPIHTFYADDSDYAHDSNDSDDPYYSDYAYNSDDAHDADYTDNPYYTDDSDHSDYAYNSHNSDDAYYADDAYNPRRQFLPGPGQQLRALLPAGHAMRRSDLPGQRQPALRKLWLLSAAGRLSDWL